MLLLKKTCFALIFISLPFSTKAANNHIDFKKKSNVMSSLKETMDYSLKRQLLLSENIASQDIPRYKAKDLVPLNNKSAFGKNNLKKVSITSTNGMHLKANLYHSKYKVITERANTNSTIQGNNVNIPEQMVKVTENMNQYNLATTIYKKMSGLVKSSIGR